MSVDNTDLISFLSKLEKLADDMPQIMNRLAVDEGRYARDQARKICREERIVDTSHYIRNFKSGSEAIKTGTLYKVDVYNNVDYAKPLEYGFRSHFVPGRYLSGKYRTLYPSGMYVGKPGGFVRGRFTLTRAKKRGEITRDARLTRELYSIINERLK